MFRKYFTCFLMILLLNLQLFGQTKIDKKAEKEAVRVAQLKAAMNSVGLGDTSPAELKLKNGGKVVGYISEMKEDSIVFAETALARTTNISYAEITSVKPYSPKPKRKVPWAMIATVAITAVTLVIAIKVCNAREKRGETCDSPETY
jgi:hypothetical protein